MRAFTDRFGKAPPRKATLLDWEKHAFASGSVKDRPRSGRKKTREETCTAVAQSIERSPMTSIRKRAAELQIPRSTMHDHIKKDLKMKGFIPMFVNELSNDMEQRVVACRALLAQFPNAVSRSLF
jgi:ABC-type lipoprotein export system ATPase subunit